MMQVHRDESLVEEPHWIAGRNHAFVELRQQNIAHGALAFQLLYGIVAIEPASGFRYHAGVGVAIR